MCCLKLIVDCLYYFRRYLFNVGLKQYELSISNDNETLNKLIPEKGVVDIITEYTNNNNPLVKQLKENFVPIIVEETWIYKTFIKSILNILFIDKHGCMTINLDKVSFTKIGNNKILVDNPHISFLSFHKSKNDIEEMIYEDLYRSILIFIDLGEYYRYMTMAGIRLERLTVKDLIA